MNPHADVLLSQTLLATRDEARTQRSVNEVFNYSEYGMNHGGSNRLHTLVYTVFGLTMGALTLVLITMLALDIPPLIVTFVILGLGFGSLATNLVLCALYLRPRRLINLLSRCALWFLIPVSTLTFFLSIIYYISS